MQAFVSARSSSRTFACCGSGFLRALNSGGETTIQIDVDGGGDQFTTLAMLTGSFSNGTIADHLIALRDPIV
jgi:hypothetical protein